MLFSPILAATASLFLNFSAHANQPECTVTELLSVPGPQATSYIDVYSSDSRQQVIQASPHVGGVQQSITRQILSELGNYDEVTPVERKQALAEAIRRYLSGQQEGTTQWRQLTDQIQALHREEPFTYVGVEQPDGDELQYRDQYFQRVQSLRELIRTHLGDLFSEEELDNLMLNLLGVEDYLRLPENEFAGLPVVATEQADLHREFLTHVRACSQLMQQLQAATQGTPYQTAFEILEPTVGEENGQLAYSRARDAFLSALFLGGAIDEDVRTRLRADFENCDFFYDESRDTALATMMLQELPEGRGYISRGAGHRAALENHFLDQCQNPPVEVTPEESDAGTE